MKLNLCLLTTLYPASQMNHKLTLIIEHKRYQECFLLKTNLQRSLARLRIWSFESEVGPRVS